MQMRPDCPLLSCHEAPAARLFNAGGGAPILLVCEHASRMIPASLNGLGLDEKAARSHAAWDIGAFDLALELSAALDAPLAASRVSRLVYDCNRPPHSEEAIRERSEDIDVPGNHDLTATQQAARVRDVYAPFRGILEEAMAGFKAAPALVTIHSFTPSWLGEPRFVEVGLLHDADARMAGTMQLALRARSELKVALNEPYAARDGVTYTLKEHAIPAAAPNVMIEVRNDLIDHPAGVARLTGLLAPAIALAAHSASRDMAS